VVHGHELPAAAGEQKFSSLLPEALPQLSSSANG
tara:strand:- start:17 stop:118 length:102 start_codon:yes stop_codon:yes gene_type:complete